MFTGKSAGVTTLTGYNGELIVSRKDDGTLTKAREEISKLVDRSEELKRQEAEGLRIKTTAEKNIADCQAKIAASQAIIADCQAKIASGKTTMAAARGTIAAEQAKVAKLSTEIFQLQQQLQGIQGQIKQLDQEDDEDDEEIARLAAELGLNDDQLVALGQQAAQGASKI